VHYQAWKKGVKSLYYCRSLSIQRAEKENDGKAAFAEAQATQAAESSDYEECLSCQ
jgi:ribonucleoside-diphosphate reductase alpha chain